MFFFLPNFRQNIHPWIQAERDTEVGGYVVTRGSQILNALGITLDDPDTFANPGEFDPEANFPDDKKPGMAFTPFGFGVRKCPGYRFLSSKRKSNV